MFVRGAGTPTTLRAGCDEGHFLPNQWNEGVLDVLAGIGDAQLAGDDPGTSYGDLVQPLIWIGGLRLGLLFGGLGGGLALALSGRHGES